MAKYGFSDLELKVIQAQAARRQMYRCEFLRQRTDPYKHATEAGYVFDPAVQRYLSMKATQLEFFHASGRSISFGLLAVVAPMVAYGYLLWNDRANKEMKIRNGELRYRDRLFKLC